MTSLPRMLAMLTEVSKRATRDTQTRDRLIVRLHARGVPLRRIGEAANLSHERVRNIIAKTPVRVD